MDTSELQGHLILLMAPSGSGKAKLVESLDEYVDRLHFLQTYTTRPRREQAQENPNYRFISRNEFEEMCEEGQFVEWAEFSGNYYGTLKTEILEAMRSGEVIFKEMELQGVEQVRTLIPKEKLTVIYIDAGGWEMLQNRILSRAAMNEKELELRRLRYEEESKARDKADVVIKNLDGQLPEAQAEFKTVITDILRRIDKQTT